MIKVAMIVTAIWLLGLTDQSLGQTFEEHEASIRRAAECLRRIPGLIEGKSTDDILNDNAHFAVVTVNRGQLAVARTFIRFHKGMREGMFRNIDHNRVANCMQGMRRVPPPQ
jgi:hypothetical protein